MDSFLAKQRRILLHNHWFRYPIVVQKLVMLCRLFQSWYPKMVFVYFFKFEPTCFKYMSKTFTLRFNFALIVAIMSFGLGILYIPIQQNQNALGYSYDSTSNPSSTSSGTAGETMNSTNSENSPIAESINGQMLQVVLKIQNSI